MTKKSKLPVPKIAKITVIGKLDSLTDLLKQRLFEYSPQSYNELVDEASRTILKGQALAKMEKNVMRCLTKNPCFRSEGKDLWSLRLDGFKENDGAYRVLQTRGMALRLAEINTELREAKKEEVPSEHKLVTDGRFLRLKDGRWGLIHWAYEEPLPEIKEANKTATSEAALAAAPPGPDSGGKPGGDDFWDKLFPLKPQDKPPAEKIPVAPAWQEIAAGAEVATLILSNEDQKSSPNREFSLISGGRSKEAAKEASELERLRQDNEDLKRENQNLLRDLENLHKRKEELRQELTQVEEQLVNLRVERDSLKKRVGHLETRLMQLQGTLNKTVSDSQSEQSRLKQQLREQEYKLQTALIANEDLERAVAELQRERQELKKRLSLWPVRLALKLCSMLGLIYMEKSPRVRSLSRQG
ncbi:MAG: hypothetical protein PWP65_1651 [Clostridia bacterium]|nr:hypothetical protein [Clostridia bacterium]